MKSMPLAFVLVNALVLMEKKAMLFIASAEITAPRQCTHYTNIKEDRINGNPTTIYTDLLSASLCTRKQPKNPWYRFNSALNVPFKYQNDELFNSTGNTKCTKNGVPLHPCRANETITSTVCFNNTNGRSIGRTVNITNCGSFYVYQLFQLTCKKNSATISRTYTKSDPLHMNCNVRNSKGPKGKLHLLDSCPQVLSGAQPK